MASFLAAWVLKTIMLTSPPKESLERLKRGHLSVITASLTGFSLNLHLSSCSLAQTDQPQPPATQVKKGMHIASYPAITWSKPFFDARRTTTSDRYLIFATKSHKFWGAVNPRLKPVCGKKKKKKKYQCSWAFRRSGPTNLNWDSTLLYAPASILQLCSTDPRFSCNLNFFPALWLYLLLWTFSLPDTDLILCVIMTCC